MKYKYLLVIMPFVLALISLTIGRFDISLNDILHFQDLSQMQKSVILNIRLPRIILALLIGAALSIAGLSLQSLFANPLVSPDILGVSQGAGFGAVLAILFFGTGFITSLGALIFGILTIVLVYAIIGFKKDIPIFMLVLSGIIVSALFSALISLVKFTADPDDKLPAITFFLMGSLANTTYKNLILAIPIFIVAITVLYLLRWRMNLLTLSDDELTSLGINIKPLRIIIILMATLIASTSVAVAGIIGWVGLVIPHLSRLLVGNNNQIVAPICLILGSSYLLIIDTLARSLTATEIPISILTAIVGAPIFIFLLKKQSANWM